MLIDEVVEFSAPSPAISSTLPAAILAVNFHYNDRDEAGGLLLKLNERTECAFAIKMTSADASLLLKDQIQVGADLIILANYFSKTTQKQVFFLPESMLRINQLFGHIFMEQGIHLIHTVLRILITPGDLFMY